MSHTRKPSWDKILRSLLALDHPQRRRWSLILLVSIGIPVTVMLQLFAISYRKPSLIAGYPTAKQLNSPLRNTTQARGQVAKPVEKLVHNHLAGIPSDLISQITLEKQDSDIKRSWIVELNYKVSESTLRSISRQLQAKNAQQSQTIAIAYCLIGMDCKTNGPWATARFKPSLGIKIHGLRIEEENLLRALPDLVAGQLVGSWLDDSAALQYKISIFRKAENFYLSQYLPNGKRTDEPLQEVDIAKGRQFVTRADGESGKSYLIDRQGRLHVHTGADLLVKMPAISPAKQLLSQEFVLESPEKQTVDNRATVEAPKKFNAEIINSVSTCRIAPGLDNPIQAVIKKGDVNLDRLSQPDANGTAWYREQAQDCWLHHSQVRFKKDDQET